ncbi:MAG: toxic anion resistance protein, partial [Lachnospiraceae bacterium]|nr:toxic anion resistance protein [Lachnospiraceae bacterium]
MPVVEDGKVVSEVMSAGASAADQLPALPIEEHLVQNANLSEEELKQVEEFSKQIDITDTAAIINYGVGTQKKLADFSEKTLESVRTKDMGEVGGMVTNLVVQLKNF